MLYRLNRARRWLLHGLARLWGRPHLPQAAQHARVCARHRRRLLPLLLLQKLALSPQLCFNLFHRHDLLHRQPSLLSNFHMSAAPSGKGICNLQ